MHKPVRSGDFARCSGGILPWSKINGTIIKIRELSGKQTHIRIHVTSWICQDVV